MLVESVAAGQVFVPFRAHDDSVFGGAGNQLFLSGVGGAAVFPGGEHRGVARGAGHALLERCAGWGGAGCGAGLRFDYGVCFVWIGLIPTVISVSRPQLQPRDP